MAECSLTTCPSSRNDIQKLAQTFENSFRYFLKHDSPFEDDYLKRLKTIAGLGFTAILIDARMLDSYQKKLHTFLQYCDFKKNEDSLSILSLSGAEMLRLAIPAFRRIERPRYYDDFVCAAEKLVHHMGSGTGNEEAESLLREILRT